MSTKTRIAAERGDEFMAATTSFVGGAPRKPGRDYTRVFTGVLFGLFIITLLLAIMAGTGVYRSLNAMSQASDNERLSLSLLANYVRSNDQVDSVAMAWVNADGYGEVQLASADEVLDSEGGSLAAPQENSMMDGPALVLRETVGDDVYETRIYRFNGTIMQEYAMADSPYTPGSATPIVDSSVFDFTYEDTLLTITTDAGSISVAMRTGVPDVALSSTVRDAEATAAADAKANAAEAGAGSYAAEAAGAAGAEGAGEGASTGTSSTADGANIGAAAGEGANTGAQPSEGGEG